MSTGRDPATGASTDAVLRSAPSARSSLSALSALSALSSLSEGGG